MHKSLIHPMNEIRLAVLLALKKSGYYCADEEVHVMNCLYETIPNFFKQPLQPVPATLPCTEDDIRNAVQRAIDDTWPNDWEVSHNDFRDRVMGYLDDWDKLITEPLPWLDQPDGEGWWWINDGVSCRVVEMCIVRGVLVTRNSSSVVRDWIGKWQRIPQPSLPGKVNG